MATKAKDWTKAIERALSLIAEGFSVRKACKDSKITKANFLKLVDGDQYARARDAQADEHFAEMVDLEDECRRGEIDPQVFRVLLDSRKWRLARMRPQVYSDKTQVDHTISAVAEVATYKVPDNGRD